MRLNPTVLLGGAVVIAATAYWLGMRHDETADEPDAHAAGGKVEFWYDPMHPDTHFDKPGKSPFMDMQLVPKYADAAPSTGVRIDPRMVENLGIRTAAVTRGRFDKAVHAVGRIVVDERSIRRVTVRADGWVEALPVRAEGEHVQERQLLAQIYSPAFDTAQREFLLALESGDAAFVAAARGRLAALAVDPAQIALLERTRKPQRDIDVYSPMRGYVMQLITRQGAAVSRDAALFELASHDPIWIVADVPESAAAWVDVGERAVATVASQPGRRFEGAVDYVYPSLDLATRTRRARVVLQNSDDALHPGMYADVALDAGVTDDALLVPTEAVIRTGERDLVVVANDDGSYRPVAVELGDARGATTVVRNGLSTGERVVVSGQFLIDSEASLRGIETRTSPSAGASAPNGAESATDGTTKAQP